MICQCGRNRANVDRIQRTPPAQPVRRRGRLEVDADTRQYRPRILFQQNTSQFTGHAPVQSDQIIGPFELYIQPYSPESFRDQYARSRGSSRIDERLCRGQAQRGVYITGRRAPGASQLPPSTGLAARQHAGPLRKPSLPQQLPRRIQGRRNFAIYKNGAGQIPPFHNP